jgi:hypothetical protein
MARTSVLSGRGDPFGLGPKVSYFARDYRRIAEKFTRRNLTALKTTSSNEAFLPFAAGSKRELIS